MLDDDAVAPVRFTKVSSINVSLVSRIYAKSRFLSVMNHVQVQDYFEFSGSSLVAESLAGRM